MPLELDVDVVEKVEPSVPKTGVGVAEGEADVGVTDVGVIPSVEVDVLLPALVEAVSEALLPFVIDEVEESPLVFFLVFFVLWLVCKVGVEGGIFARMHYSGVHKECIADSLMCAGGRKLEYTANYQNGKGGVKKESRTGHKGEHHEHQCTMH